MSRFLLLANGPGEFWGWTRPLAWALHERGHAVAMQLLPCPFASGQETRIAESLPGTTCQPLPLPSLALALARSEAEGVVQLGGDLLFGRWARASGGRPLAAYTYGAKPGLGRCDAVFTAFETLRNSLSRPASVIGDLVASAVELDGTGPVWNEGESPRVVLYPGSRPAIRAVALPFLTEMADSLRRIYPRLGLRTLLAPFAADGEYPLWEEAGLSPTRHGAGAVLRGADFAVTQPGTNTLELLHRRVPGLVAVPFAFLRKIPLAGLKGWLAATPLLGGWAKERYLRHLASRKGFLAWPNIIAARELLEEKVGDWGPRELAASVAAFLDDGRRLESCRRGLEAIADDGKAANRLVLALEELIASS
ncbi:MAG: hypothetical protein JMJ93_07150 [Synergistaceae bacterium]|jgi:lipid-A-disaccharide synthase|nr:hypothetical protein [Synergistaceae bacterium]